MSVDDEMRRDARWCEGGEDRIGEYGVIGAEQADESHLDGRSEHSEDGGLTRIKISRKKLYGRDEELIKLHTLYTAVSSSTNRNSTSNDSSSSAASQIIFLSGYSGCGKSALVDEFSKQLKGKSLPHILVSGKYDELQSSSPFSAIVDGLATWCNAMTAEDKKDFQHIKSEMATSIGQDAAMLVDLVPHLGNIILGSDESVKQMLTTSSRRLRAQQLSSSRHMNVGGQAVSKTRLLYIFHAFMKCLCTRNRPVIMFIDDLQWADDSSLELFDSILGDVTMEHLLFIGAYRSNEVHADHPFQAVMDDIKKRRSQQHGAVIDMVLNQLSKVEIREFLADTLNYEQHEDVEELSSAIYTKTLGNIFYTIQATEQLARKGLLYYDTMIFTWQWNLSKKQLEDELSGDILDMVKSKIKYMSQNVQDAITVAAYIRTAFDVGTLLKVMVASGFQELNEKQLLKTLNIAVEEGLLLHETSSSMSSSSNYSFAHDRIQEAARSLVQNEQKDSLLIKIGNALVARWSSDEHGEDWMLFVGVHHLNSIAKHYQDKLHLASLNLTTAELSVQIAAHEKAAQSLKAGIQCLDKSIRWTDTYYQLSIQLFNLLLDTEFGLGNYESVKDLIDEVLTNAKTDYDKGTAYCHSIGIIAQAKERDHVAALKKGIEILKTLGITITSDPADDVVKPEEIEEAEKQRKLALGKRKVIDLINSEVLKDDTALRVIDKMARSSIQSGKISLIYLLGEIAITICAKNGIDEYLPRIYVFTNAYFRKVKPDLKKAYEIAVTCQTMIDQIPSVSEDSKCKCGISCQNAFQLFQPPASGVEAFHECYKYGIKAGDTEWAFIGAVGYGLAYFISGAPITSLTEPKFALFEEECKRFRQPPSVYVFFTLCRQLTLSLQGKTKDPNKFDGRVMTEKDIMDNFTPDTPPYKQTNRDMSIMKLMVACIYKDDLVTMKNMIGNLKSWPDFDPLINRLNLRLFFLALGAYILDRSSSDRLEKSMFKEIGKKYSKWFQDSAAKGQPIAEALFLCLQAEDKQTKKNYNKAIKACSKLSLIHIEAIMNENCGLCQLQRKKIKKGETYLEAALRMYNKWGASGKVQQMKMQHKCLTDVKI